MAEPQRGIGRGLAAILTVSPKDAPEELRQIPLELIDPNPNQPRRTFEEESLAGLAESIRARGVLQAVLVRPLAGGRYELVAGERRWRAAQLAELKTVPAIVRHHDDAASLEVALIENMSPRRTWGDAARRARQQPQTKPFLESTDGVAQRRLRYPQLGSRFGEAPFARDREKGKEIVDVLARHS